MIEAFLFDIGNVLVTFDFSRAMRRLAERSVLDSDEIGAKLTPLILDLECGRLGNDDFIRAGITASRFSGPAEKFAVIYREIFEPHVPMESLVDQLRQRFPLYLLSNTSSLHLDHLRTSFGVFGHFAGGVFSHEAASLKPGEKIFRDVIERCRLDPARTFYLDDIIANTEAATRLGFQTYTYNWRDHGGFEAFLRESGLL
ncbi:MAG: HAD-IA family hydrolase [Verrucomicrobiales bacterium]